MEKQKKSDKLTSKDVWKLFKETDKQFKETDKQFKETDKQFKETDKQFKETDKKFQETDKQFKETDKKFQETDKQFKETDKKFQETDKKFQETDKQFQELKQLYAENAKQMKSINDKWSQSESRWAKFVEALVDGSLCRILNERNIMVGDTTQRDKGTYNGQQFEYDILAHNGTEMVVVEVKTTLGVDDVKDFIEDMKLFKERKPLFSQFTIYSGVAFVTAESKAEVLAAKNGFFVIKATGDSAIIINKENFKPKVW